MSNKQPSKADQVAALRVARAHRPKTSLELDAALAVLLPKAKSSDGSGGREFAALHPSEQSGHEAMGKRDGVSSGPSDANSGAPQPRGEPLQTNATQPSGSPNKRAARGTFDRKAYQRELMRKRRAEGKGDYQRKTTNPNYKGARRQAEKREGGK